MNNNNKSMLRQKHIRKDIIERVNFENTWFQLLKLLYRKALHELLSFSNT